MRPGDVIAFKPGREAQDGDVVLVEADGWRGLGLILRGEVVVGRGQSRPLAEVMVLASAGEIAIRSVASGSRIPLRAAVLCARCEMEPRDEVVDSYCSRCRSGMARDLREAEKAKPARGSRVPAAKPAPQPFNGGQPFAVEAVMTDRLPGVRTGDRILFAPGSEAQEGDIVFAKVEGHDVPAVYEGGRVVVRYAGLDAETYAEAGAILAVATEVHRAMRAA